MAYSYPTSASASVLPEMAFTVPCVLSHTHPTGQLLRMRRGQFVWGTTQRWGYNHVRAYKFQLATPNAEAIISGHLAIGAFILGWSIVRREILRRVASRAMKHSSPFSPFETQPWKVPRSASSRLKTLRHT
jgi:hypothetical protein